MVTVLLQPEATENADGARVVPSVLAMLQLRKSPTILGYLPTAQRCLLQSSWKSILLLCHTCGNGVLTPFLPLVDLRLAHRCCLLMLNFMLL